MEKQLIMFGFTKEEGVATSKEGNWVYLDRADNFDFAKQEVEFHFQEGFEKVRLLEVSPNGVASVVAEFRPVHVKNDVSWPVVAIPI